MQRIGTGESPRIEEFVDLMKESIDEKHRWNIRETRVHVNTWKLELESLIPSLRGVAGF